ncbi:MAG: hypothetical protein R2708_24815 [Vicinamibacterales bacterium]
MTFLLALSALGALILAGLALRRVAPIVGRLLLPASVVGGFLGLALGPFGARVLPDAMVAAWAAWPTVLINLVFAGLFLGAPVPSLASVAGRARPLLQFSLVMALGQYVVGLLLTWLVLTPVFGVPAAFACLIEVGFSGGHGTAGAMASVFAGLDFPAGGALGQMSATVGLLTGVVGGVALVHWGARRGHASQVTDGAIAGGDDPTGLLPAAGRRPIATGTVSAAVVEPLTLHLAVMLLAILAGWVVLAVLQWAHPAFEAFPLFPMAMLAGMALQVVADRTGLAAWFDRATFQRLTGLALDVLVAAAIASMRLDLVLQNLAPFSLLMLAAIAWCVGVFLWLGPRMLREDWFEQALVVYGTQTGVAAVGLMLLRLADPHTRTSAAQAFAARSMVVSPLVGGGLVTAAMPLLITRVGPAGMLAVMTAAVALCGLWRPRAVTS